MLWFFGSSLLFLAAQRWLHREVQLLLLLITRRPALSVGLFAFLFFPGVVVHETSHWAAARLLGVRTGRITLMPRATQQGVLRLGSVETGRTDPLRDSLIGAAPLITGSLLVAWIGSRFLGLSPLAERVRAGEWDAFYQMLPQATQLPDFWLWFYLAVAVSSMMLPSVSDRRSFHLLAAGAGLLLALSLMIGAGPWLLSHLSPAFTSFLDALTMVFFFCLGLHACLALPLLIARLTLSRLLGVRFVRTTG